MTTICLCMIVKNEAAVIGRCLGSVRPIVDRWVIVDTGSTDGTQDIIRQHLVDLPGELYERPWRDFAHNRSEALALAREKSDYTLIIDADDILEIPVDMVLPVLTADSYTVDIIDADSVYRRPQFVRSALSWRYEGVLHEYLVCEEADSSGHLTQVRMRRGHGGARRRDPETYQRDAAVLEAALQTETRPDLLARYRFYLAQSYRDCGNKEQALENYLARADQGLWQEEVFISLYRAAKLKEELGHPEQDVIDVYLRASDAAPARAEALHGASRFCRHKSRHEEGYQLAKRGLLIAMPSDGLFVEPWIYETGLLDELGNNAYWSGHYKASLDANLKILATGKFSGEAQERVIANARAASDKLPGEANLGSPGREDYVAQHALGTSRPLRTRLDNPKRVLVAILAKQKEPSLPLYLECIEALDYPKSSVVLYIRTNNNTDSTEQILRDWIARVGHLYAAVEFDAEDVATRVEEFGVHEWNPTRFRVLGQIRNVSLQRTHEHRCDFYFTADVDNFIRQCTLRELVALNLPIVAPMLRTINPNLLFSNYHAEVDANGYYEDCDQYSWVVHRHIRGVVEVPVVHCTYLVRADVLDELTYQDATDRFEYVVFCDSARKSGVPQYFDNRQTYGYIAFDKGGIHYAEHDFERARSLLDPELRANVSHGTLSVGNSATSEAQTPENPSEETWDAQLKRARLLLQRGDEAGFMREAMAAYDRRPERAEPLFDLAKYHREKGRNEAALIFAETGLTLARPINDVPPQDDHIYEVGLKQEYSIAGFYTQDKARRQLAHDYCDWIALTPHRWDEARTLARHNIAFYTVKAETFLPSIRLSQIAFDAPETFSSGNVSLTMHEGVLRAHVRAVNYVTINGHMDTRGNGPLNSRNFLLRLDDELRTVSSTEIMEPDDLPPRVQTLYLGFEDGRIFSWRGDIWSLTTTWHFDADDACRMVLARLQLRDDGQWQMTDWRVLPNRQSLEKNWMPFLEGDELRFIYSLDPLRVLDASGRLISETPVSIVARDIRGGTNLLPFDGGWLCVTHEFAWIDTCRRYSHRFVWLDADLQPRKLTRRFYFSLKQSEFAMGLIVHPHRPTLLVSFGQDNAESWIAEVSPMELRQALHPVDRYRLDCPVV